jgi:O-antigen/teichoic acid export membrane protein
VRHAFREADVFLVRAFLDTSAIGQYQLVKQIASVPERLTNPLFHSALPAMASLWAKQDLTAIRSLIRSTALIGIALALLLVVGWLSIGLPALSLTVGVEYRAVYLPAAIALLGTSSWPATFGYSTLRLAMGLADEKLRWTIWVSLAALALQVVLLPAFGLAGAAAGYAIASALFVVTTAMIVRARLPKPH